MVKFKLTPAALNDLREIARYTENKWGTDKRNQYLTAIDNRFHWLAENPNFGKRRDEIKTGFYSYPEGRHVIFYRVKNDVIEILGVLHQSMDFKQHL